MNFQDKLEFKNSFDGSLVYGTRKFNKTTGRNDHYGIAVKQATEFFICPETGCLKEEIVEYRKCPVCDQNKNVEVFTKDGFCHVKCVCGFIYVNPTAKDSFRDIFFKDVYQTWTEVLLTEDQESMDYKKFLYGLRFIESHSQKGGMIVDIGTGPGLFLQIARDSGWRVSGVEFNNKAVEHLRSIGLEIFDKPLESNIYKKNSIDVVAIWEVLEHINGPNIFLNEISSILRKNGLLFICVPNINSLVTRILHERSQTFGGSTHVNFFSIETLGKLCERHGFKILDTDTVISEIDTIKNYLCYEDPYSGCTEMKLDYINPEFIYKNKLGSKIFMLCKKID